MTIQEYVRLLRRRWAVIALVAAASTAIAASITLSETPKYAATAKLFVTPAKTKDPAVAFFLQGLLTQDRIQTLGSLVNSRAAARAVAEDLGLKTSPERLQRQVRVIVPEKTVIIQIRALDTSPARAQAIANAFAKRFAQLASRLGTSTGTGLGGLQVAVADAASLPTKPVSPRKFRDILFGIVIGLIAGMGLAIVIEIFDTRLRTPEALSEEFDLGVLGVVEYDKHLQDPDVLQHLELHSGTAESFRHLRTNVHFADLDNPPRSILVTSAVPAEGKSTVAALLAQTYAIGGNRALLVECDLRRSSQLSARFGLAARPGLVDYLRGTAKPNEILQRVAFDFGQSANGGAPDTEALSEFVCITAGSSVPNPPELLETDRFRTFLEDVSGVYDVVILDSTPLLPFTDAAVLSTVADGVLFVVRAHRTSREKIDRALLALDAVKGRLFGAVFNMAPAHGPDARRAYYDDYYKYPGAEREAAPAATAQ